MLYQNELAAKAAKLAMPRLEQENLFWMRAVVGKLTQVADSVVNFCVSICSTAKACMFLNHHRKFVGCDLDAKVLSVVQPDVTLWFVL